jgi:hypothetical protein
MKPITKWASIIGVAVAMLLLLYFTGVVNSKVSLGVAVAVMGVTVLLATLLVPPPKDKK